MPASQARRLCPTAIVIPPDFTAYREKSREVWDLVRARLDRLQSMGLDEAYADLTGVEKPLRVLRELIDEVKKQTGIQISAGVGPNRLIAKCCSDLGKPAGFVAMGREEACIRFATAPTRRLPGIGPKTAERLASLGYSTVAQLQEADEAELARRFGDRTARYLKARASFHDDSPVETEGGPAKSVSTERTFDTDIASHEELETILRTLSKELCEGLQRKSRQAARWRSRSVSPTGPRSPAPARSRTRPTTPPSSPTPRWSCCAPTPPRSPCACSACAWRRSTTWSRTSRRPPSPPWGSLRCRYDTGSIPAAPPRPSDL